MLNIRSLVKQTALLVSVLLLASLSYAADEQRYYDIELVLFQNSDALKTLVELNREPQPLKLPETYIQLGQPRTEAVSNYIPDYYFTLLPESEYKLTDAATKIASSKAYRIIKHIAWRQPGLDKSVALPVYFQEDIAAALPAQPAGTETPVPPLYTSARLEALITVSLSRYLHMESELRFQADGLAPLAETPVIATTSDPNTVTKPRPTTVVYVSRQTRRMRSKELHYIDHPVIGMLVLMTPVEIPKQVVKPAARTAVKP